MKHAWWLRWSFLPLLILGSQARRCENASSSRSCHSLAESVTARECPGHLMTHPPKKAFMSGMNDEQQQRNAQWGKVSRLFWPAMGISAALTAIAEALYRTGAYPHAMFDGGSTDVRTWLYVALMYLIAIPVLFLWIRRLLAGYPMPWNPLAKRWLLGAFSLILCSGMVLLPAIVLTVGAGAADRGKGLYQLFTGSLLDTFFVGTILAYGAAMGAWLLIVGTPKLLFPKPPER